MDQKEEIIKILKELEELNRTFYNGEYSFKIKKFIKDKKISLGLIPKYPTLREFFTENSSSSVAYNFCIPHTPVSCRCYNIEDFKKYYNENLLDQYYVVKKHCTGSDMFSSEYKLELCRIGEEDETV